MLMINANYRVFYHFVKIWECTFGIAKTFTKIRMAHFHVIFNLSLLCFSGACEIVFVFSAVQVDVYLDALFAPLMAREPHIFEQEAWHYALQDAEKPEAVEVRGVVLSEMRGVLSDPDTRLDQLLARSLFPNTTYKYESGGMPMVSVHALPSLARKPVKRLALLVKTIEFFFMHY
jgi:hypothetical protein